MIKVVIGNQGEVMEIIVKGNDKQYLFSGDSLYVQNRLGDTILPDLHGRWTFLEKCSSLEEAEKLAALWEEIRKQG